MSQVQLGSLTLQPRRQLLDGGTRLPLGRRALDILSVLAEAKGEIVTKDEIFEAVWPGVIVEENAIQVHVAALRKALGPEAHRLTTVRGLGYKLELPEQPPQPLKQEGRNSVAILPFVNLTGDVSLDYLCEGLTREVTSRLSRQTDLKLAAWLSANAFKNRAADIRTAGRQLGVETVVEGWIRRRDDQFIVGAELADASSGYQLWSGRFESALDDFFSLDDELAAAVAKALEKQLASPKLKEINPEALEEFLKGMAKGAHWQPENVDEVLDHFRRARTIAPDFAKAWAAFAQHGFGRLISGKVELLDEFRASAERALLLDPTLVEGHQALAGICLLTGEWELLEQHSGLEDICPMRSTFLSTIGQLELAMVHCDLTLVNNPLCSENHAAFAVTAWQIGNYEKAKELTTQAVSRGFLRDWMPVPLILAEAALADGDPAAAAHEMAKAFAPLGCAGEAEGDLRLVFAALAGQAAGKELAIAALRRLQEREPVAGALYGMPVIAGLLMMWNARLGELDHAYALAEGIVPAWKETGLIDQPSIMLFWPQEMQTFREDPRFMLLCGQLGMVEYWRRYGMPRSLSGHPLAEEFCDRAHAG